MAVAFATRYGIINDEEQGIAYAFAGGVYESFPAPPAAPSTGLFSASSWSAVDFTALTFTAVTWSSSNDGDCL